MSVIDLVICTYNNAPLLDRTLAAIEKQQVSAAVQWSVLVVDNNCTDETAEVVEKYARANTIPQLRRVLETKQGLTYARLCGIQNTAAQWVAFVDDDCLLAADWVEQAVKFSVLHPDCGAFGGQVILDWETPPPSFVLNFGYSLAQQDQGAVPKPVSCLVGAGLIVRREAIVATGWLEKQFMSDRIGKKLISGGDVEMALRIGANYKLWYSPACRLHHVVPAWRTTNAYLQKINYGLGTSQVFGDSMTWAGSYLKWFYVSTQETLRDSIKILIPALKAGIKRRSAPEVAITWSFLQGKWVGIWRMLWLDAEERRSLMGCATSEK